MNAPVIEEPQQIRYNAYVTASPLRELLLISYKNVYLRFAIFASRKLPWQRILKADNKPSNNVSIRSTSKNNGACSYLGVFPNGECLVKDLPFPAVKKLSD